MNKCMYCDIHFHLCHNGKSDIFLQQCQRQKKSCSLFVARESTDKKQKNKKQIEELDWTNDKKTHYVHVYWHNSSCFTKKHKRTDYWVKIDNYDDEDVKIRIFYCHTCNVFYTNGNLLPDQDILHIIRRKIVLFNMPDSYYKYNDMSPQSILRKNGYTVREGSVAFQRHKILDHIINSGILTPYQIINHLGGLIDWHYWDSKWDNAVSKWQEDIHYVQNLDVEEHEGKFKIIHKPARKK